MRALLLVLLVGCTTQYICEAPCNGQSAQEEHEAGIVCFCVGSGNYSDVATPDGVEVLLEQPGILAAKFDWTDQMSKCQTYRQWWFARAPMPCAQPGGGKKQSNP